MDEWFCEIGHLRYRDDAAVTADDTGKIQRPAQAENEMAHLAHTSATATFHGAAVIHGQFPSRGPCIERQANSPATSRGEAMPKRPLNEFLGNEAQVVEDHLWNSFGGGDAADRHVARHVSINHHPRA